MTKRLASACLIALIAIPLTALCACWGPGEMDEATPAEPSPSMQASRAGEPEPTDVLKEGPDEQAPDESVSGNDGRQAPAESSSLNADEQASDGSASADVDGQVPDESSSVNADARETAEGATVDGAEALRETLNISEDYRESFVHGEKPAQYQKYIVLHDTESESDAAGVVDYWDGNGAGVAAHFIINKDGSIVQCVPLDAITHHAGFGDTGHNKLYGVEDESRDDKAGTVPIGPDFADYGMNSWSVGIEMVHVGGSGEYPGEQLDALDTLISYIDAYFGFESQIIDHKAWRSGNSDTSAEFAVHLTSYQETRKHA